ncbi:hypothetical protein WA1_45160 [Scytonema hofmannii PCC 7110]|uniref:Acyltransferase 3 domain-containing protein n=1 Tax=Scytonema hofmannii PCC 7110 TaxID=128403 RepID=A0A139WWR6_9CYAN|nr:acyltransferase [Scytonema hofmannii]KYC36853.1 hypothetical protein WA1_45160 [Scytonema hofmannii PCC 7110]
MKTVKLVELRRDNRSTVHLDLLRGLAALVVLTNHLRNLFFVDYGQVIHKNILVNIFYYFSSFGYQAVIVFFVLSGFCISLTVIKSIENWSWKIYFINRLSRLYVVLIIALFLGLFLDYLGITIWDKNSIYYRNFLGSNIIDSPVVNRLKISIFIGNIFFLQNIRVTTFGSNDPLWSLSSEFWYYVLFPCILLIVYPKINLVTKFLHTFIVLTIFKFIGNSIAIYFFIWLLGTPVCLTGNLRIKNPIYKFLSILVSSLIFLLTLLLIKFNILMNSYLSDFILAIVTAILIYSLLQDNRKQPVDSHAFWYSYKIISQKLAGFSYTLYLVHMPILVFINACLLKETRWQPDTFHLLVGLILLLLVLGYAFSISLFTEAKTEKLRDFLKSSLLK